jgi:hypothetical protein
MRLLRFFKGKSKQAFAAARLHIDLMVPWNQDLLPFNQNHWQESLRDPTNYYINCVRYFYQNAPGFLKNHRAYFSHNNRGFGEAAFHVMWAALCQLCRPATFLEIGVYRGQVISLISSCGKHFKFDCEVSGISPFSPAGDSVSKYASGLDYFQDTLTNFQFFKLPPPTLQRGLSTDKDIVKSFKSKAWDMIYIDGNHEYEVVREDFINCAQALNSGGKIILDDSALYTSYNPPAYASAGHPGPSKLAAGLGEFGFTEILRVGHNRVFQRNA